MNRTPIGPYHIEVPGHPGIFVAVNFDHRGCPELDSYEIAAAESYLRIVNMAPEMLDALHLTHGTASGPFHDSHSPYWCLNEDQMNAIAATIAKATGA